MVRKYIWKINKIKQIRVKHHHLHNRQQISSSGQITNYPSSWQVLFSRSHFLRCLENEVRVDSLRMPLCTPHPSPSALSSHLRWCMCVCVHVCMWCLSKGRVLTVASALPNQSGDLDNTALQTCWGGAKGAPLIDVIKLILAPQGGVPCGAGETCSVLPIMKHRLGVWGLWSDMNLCSRRVDILCDRSSTFGLDLGWGWR